MREIDALEIKRSVAPFRSGEGQWQGVVVIQRNFKPEVCRVLSARTQVMGLRAIVCEVPYAMVRHYFRAEDGEFVCVYAEFDRGHLEFYERASARDFYRHPEVLQPRSTQ